MSSTITLSSLPLHSRTSVERFSLSRRRRLERKTLSDVARSPSLRHHAACCARGLSPRRAFFDFRTRDIAGGASLWPVAPPVSIVSPNRARYVDPRSLSCRSIVTAQPRLRSSLTRAPDQAAIGAEVSPPVNLDLADAHVHARFRTKRQSFLRFKRRRLMHTLGWRTPILPLKAEARSSNPFGGESLQSEP